MIPIQQHMLWTVLVGAMHLLGVLSAVSAVLSARSSQSAIAWAIACVTFPYLAVPAYWILGTSRFHGYVLARRSSNVRLHEAVSALRRHAPDRTGLPEDFRQSCEVFEQLSAMPFTCGNTTELLVDGEASFDAIFRQIQQAKKYILVQFFIVRADGLGRRMLDALAKKVAEGVSVYFLYDAVGSHALPRRYVTELRDAGIDARAFKATRGLSTRFQINFRNHRKMVVVDGSWASTGGANLGDEYCGRSERFGYWRDTMVAVTGPAVKEVQLSFAEDWFFVTGDMPELDWDTGESVDGGRSVLVLPTGPADELPSCSMMFTQAIHAAEERLWITSPYFVPDNEIVRALELAALRGVDVRILLPHNPDHHLVYWASFTYLEELEKTGVKFFRYTRGLLHEKVVLIDDRLALVGSANTDNRSFYLNFELTLMVADRGFAEEVADMIANDLTYGREAGSEELRRRGFLFRLTARLARLLSPIL